MAQTFVGDVAIAMTVVGVRSLHDVIEHVSFAREIDRDIAAAISGDTMRGIAQLIVSEKVGIVSQRAVEAVDRRAENGQRHQLLDEEAAPAD